MPTITFTIDDTIPGVGPKRLTFRPRQAFVTGAGHIVPDLPRPILDKPYVRGVEHSENLPEGPWSVEGIENGKLVPFDVGPTGGALQDLIALGVPGDAPATTLSQAVTSWMNANVNTEVTEPLVEGILADPESSARTVLDSTYAPKWFVSVRERGAVGNGVTDDKAAFASAVSEVADGGTIVVPAGVYRNAKCTNAGKTITWRFDPGAKIFVDSADFAFDFAGTWGTTRAVTAQGTGTYTSGSTGTVTAPTLTLSTSSHGLVVGDVIRVFADDLILERRPGDGTLESRVGEFATVAAVSGETITLASPLLDTYVTNVRVAKLDDKTVRIEGRPVVEYAPGLLTGTTQVGRFTALRRPTIEDIKIVNGPSIGLIFIGCYGYVVGVDCADLVDNTATDQYGYAVSDVSSTGGVVRFSASRRGRHAFTDDTNRIAAGSATPHAYGRSIGATITVLGAVDSLSAAVSPHHCGAFHTFTGITVNGGSGFGLRGIHHQWIDCTFLNTWGGVGATTDAQGGITYGHRIINPRILSRVPNTTQFAFSFGMHQSATDPQYGQNDGRLIAEIIGGRVEGYAKLLRAEKANIRISGDLQYVAPASVPNNTSFIVLADNARLDVDSLTLDLRDNTSGNTLAAVYIEDDTSTITTERVRVRDTTSVTGRLSRWILAAEPATVVRAHGWKFDSWGAEYGFSGHLWSGVNEALSTVNWERGEHTGGSWFFTRTAPQVANAFSALRCVSDHHVMARCSSSGAADQDYNLGTLPAGHHKGQLFSIVFNNQTYPSRNLVVRHGGATYGVVTPTGGDLTVSSGRVVTFIYEDYWRVQSIAPASV